jgi:hypothetical protein
MIRRMKRMKKILVLLMAFVMTVGMMIPSAAFAEGEEQQGESPVAGVVIPFGIYEPDETLLYESTKLKIFCEKVHVAHTFTAEVAFTSTNYDKVTIGEVTYEPYTVTVGEEKRAVFLLPFDYNQPLKITAHTTAMGGKDIDYTLDIKLDKDNLKPVARGTLTDGTYTTEVNTNKAAYGWKINKGVLQKGFSYPGKDYSFQVTVIVKDGKIADLGYTINAYDIVANTGSDVNYLLWAMDGHVVSDKCYQSKTVDNGATYHISPDPARNGKGMKGQFTGKSDITGIDTVSAATLTSRAIISAVDADLTKAERGEKDVPDTVLPGPDTSKDVIPSDGYYLAQGSCIGADLDDVKNIILQSKDGKITLKRLYIQQRAATYPHVFFGTEAEAIAAGENLPKPVDYDWGYKYAGTRYSDIDIKSLDKQQLFQMYASSSDTWFNRPVKIDSATLKPALEESIGVADAQDNLEMVMFFNGATPSPEETAVVKQAFNEAIDTLANRVSGDTGYTAASREAVAAAAAALKEVVAKETVTKDEISAAKIALDEQVAGLVKMEASKLTVKGANKTYKAAALKKKAKSYKAVTVKNPAGKVTYTAKGVNSKSKKALKFTAKTGKITVKKGTKKGTYKMKVTVKDAGSATVKGATKTVTCTVKVK